MCRWRGGSGSLSDGWVVGQGRQVVEMTVSPSIFPSLPFCLSLSLGGGGMPGTLAQAGTLEAHPF